MKIKYTSTFLNLISFKHLITLAIWLLSFVFCLSSHAAGTWTVTGSMNTARWGHTATLLFNDKILVAGGCDQYWCSGNAFTSAELYDPSSGKWSQTGSMNAARGLHTATLLANGKVLVVGGCYNSCNSSISNAELYDPSNGQWNQAASMSIARNNHTATMLNNGKILVVGGDHRNSGELDVVDLYDFSNGQWNQTSPLSLARGYHTATLLSSGKVLIAGGYNNGSYPTSTELYDPLNEIWSQTDTLATGRSWATSTLLNNGNVLITGGHTGPAVAGSELYDPSNGQWKQITSTARYLPTATMLADDKVLVVGGNTVIAELYDSSNGAWSQAGSISTIRYRHTATLLSNDKVLITGGTDGSHILSSAELYTPDTLTTIPIAITNAPSLITSTSATLTGTVNPNGAATSATFDFGLTTNYGTSLPATPATIAATAGATSVSAAKTGLTCHTTYHYRVTATNSAGTATGNDQSFTTANCPPVNGVCGTANGATFFTAPTTNLCSTGTASAVTGTGPWNWNCNGANGGTTASCSANLTPTNANAWLYPPNSTVLVERPIELNIYANSNGVKIGSYDFLIKYESSKLAIDYLTSITQCTKEAVCPGTDGWSNYTIINAPSSLIENGITYGTIRVSGLNTTGTGPGTSLQLLKIYLKTQIVPSTTAVNLTINRLESTYLNPIGTQNSAGGSATIRITPGLCGDADGNGAVNIIDALAIARKQVGLPPPPYVNVDLANVKRSDELNITDAMLIARYSVGLLIPPEACAIGQPL